MPQIDFPDTGDFTAPLDPLAVAHPGDTITEQRPGLLATSILSYKTGSVLGQFGENFVRNAVDEAMIPAEPGFDPYKIATPQYLADNPWMAKPFLNGTMDYVKSSAHMAGIEYRQAQDWADRERLGQASLPYSIAGGILGSLPDTMVAAPFGELFGASRAVAGWTKAGSVMSQLAKTAGVAGALNLAQEELGRAGSPNRNVDEVQAAAAAFVLGAGLGTTIHGIASGYKHWVNGRSIPTPIVDDIRANVAETVVGPTLGNYEEVGRADLEHAMARDSQITSPPIPPLVDTTPIEINPINVSPQELARVSRSVLSDSERQRLGINVVPSKPFVPPQPNILQQLIEARDEADILLGRKSPAKPASVPAAVSDSDYYSQIARDRYRLGLTDLEPPPAENAAILKDIGSPLPAPSPVQAVESAGSPAPVASPIQAPIPPADNAAPRKFSYSFDPETGTVQTTELKRPSGAAGAASAAEFAGTNPVSARENFKILEDAAKPQYTILRTKENAAETDAFMASHPEANFNEHPQQALYDLRQEIDAVASEDLGKFGESVSSALQIVGGNKELKSGKPGSKSSVAMNAYHTLFDSSVNEARIAQGGVDAPARSIPAEGYLDILRGMASENNQNLADIRAEIKRGPAFEYTYSDGRMVVFGGGKMDKDEFWNAMFDHMAGSRKVSEQLDAPKGIKDAVASYHARMQSMAAIEHEVGLLAKPADPDRYYMPHHWNSEKVSADKQNFIDQLISHQREQFRLDPEGKLADHNSRPVIEQAITHGREDRIQSNSPEANKFSPRSVTSKGVGKVGYAEPANRQGGFGLNEEERDIITEAAKQKGGFDKMTVGDLAAINPSLPERYLQELDVMFKRRAEVMTDSILKLGAVDGFQPSSPSVFKGRVDIDELKFKEYLHTNIGALNEMYNHKVLGQIAARQAIKARESYWEPIIKKLTGKSLAEEGYDPNLIIEAIKKDYQRMADAASKAGDTEMQARVQAIKDKTGKAFQARMEAITGSSYDQRMLPGFSNFAARQVGKGVTMAYMGKAVIANLGEIVNISLASRMNEKNMGFLENFFRSFSGVSKEQLGHFAAIAEDNSRHAFEVGDIFGRTETPFGSGSVGKFGAKVDRATSYLTNQFIKSTGMTALETWKKRMTGGLVQQGIIQDARKLVRAKELMAGGMAEAKALAKAGLSDQRLRDLNVQGINADRAKRLMAKLDKYASDYKTGQRVDSSFDGTIHPEIQSWMNEDKDLFNAFNFAVNSTVKDIITTPKILSRPISQISKAPGTEWVKLVHQFQNFAYSFGNQTAMRVIDKPGIAQAAFVARTIASYMLVDGLYKVIGGKYSPEGLVQDWREKPIGMMYSALNRSPLLGWYQRPLGALESTGYGPGRVLGNPQLSTVYGRQGATIGDMLGPGYGWSQNILSGVVQSWADGTWSSPERRKAYNALPFRNHILVESANRFVEALGYDTPIGPTPKKVR